MKKFLQKLSLRVEDGWGTNLKNKVSGFISSHPEIFCLSLLALACFVFLFFGLNNYPLLDVDETRYAVMARDLASSWNWNDLRLNTAPFLEKPPLYFWIVATSINLFGTFSAWVVRLPIALLATLLVFFTYFFGKKVISRKFGMISALILISSIFFLILSHIAIIDMVLTVFMTSALYCAFLTHFCEEKYKKYYWWYFYTFIGVGFMAKGLLALAIPITVMFVYNALTKTLKDMFKPINMLPGILIFLLVIVPWHFIMYQHYGYQFVKEYFLVHHFGRFMGSEYIGRERPFLYFVPVFLLGFMPWTFIFIAFLFDGFKKLTAKFKATEGKLKEKIAALFEVTNNEQKLLLFASVYFIVVFLVFSISSTKLPTYILPIFPAAALLTGYFWWIGDEKGENESLIYNSTLIFSTLFIILGFCAAISFYFLPYDIQYSLSKFNQATVVGLFLLAVLLVLRLNTKRALSIFSGYILVMFFIIIISVFEIFNFVYSGGENEIVRYSRWTLRPDVATQLVTFDFAVKPSVLIHSTKKVTFITDPDFDQLDKLLQYECGPTFVIVKNVNLKDNEDYSKKIEDRLKLVNKGKKYSLYVKEPKRKKACLTKIGRIKKLLSIKR